MLIPTGVAIIIFLCRVYSRALVLKKWWIDDTLTLISMVRHPLRCAKLQLVAAHEMNSANILY